MPRSLILASARLAGLVLVLLAGIVAGGAQSGTQPSSPAKQCADRWNDMKAKDQIGDQTYRDFARKCLAEVTEGVPPAAKPTTPVPRTPTGAAAAEARPSIKQCADLWNELKAKNQTGDQTYRDFAQQCLAGSTAQPKEEAAAKPEEKSTAQKPRTSVPVVPLGPTPEPPAALARKPDENDREAVNRCNGEWQDYKARHNLTGAKAWHVFMARCLP